MMKKTIMMMTMKEKPCYSEGGGEATDGNQSNILHFRFNITGFNTTHTYKNTYKSKTETSHKIKGLAKQKFYKMRNKL